MASTSGKGKNKHPPEPKPSEEFEVILDELPKTYKKTMSSIPRALKRILKKQSPRNSKGRSFFKKAFGKLYTPVDAAGTFLIKIKPTRDCPAEDIVTLLYRWSDLYFEAFHAGGIWYRLSDAQEDLPPRSQVAYPMKNGVIDLLSIKTSYAGIGGYDTEVGPGAFWKLYKTLMMAGEIVANKEYMKFRNGPLSLATVAFSEALRFIELQQWVVHIISLDGFGELVPPRFSKHFNSWENDSSLMFLPKAPPVEVAARLGIIKTGMMRQSPDCAHMKSPSRLRRLRHLQKMTETVGVSC